MEKHLKKRIVGAVVTVSAVAILLPVIIDGSGKQLTLEGNIPPQPPLPDWHKVDNQKRIKIDLEKLASGDAARHLTPPTMDTSPQDDPQPLSTGVDAAEIAAANTTSSSQSSGSGKGEGTTDTSGAKDGKPVGKVVVSNATATGSDKKEPKQPVKNKLPAAGDTPQLDDTNLPYAWVVQLGAFANEENAREFRDKLRSQGFKSYTNTQIDGLTRVYVGPELKRETAESLRQRLVLLLDNDKLPIKRYRAL